MGPSDARSTQRDPLSVGCHSLCAGFRRKHRHLDVDLPQLHYVFKRESAEQLANGTSITVISKGPDIIRLALIREEDTTVALPIRLHTNEPPEALAIGDVPKLFIFLPLVVCLRSVCQPLSIAGHSSLWRDVTVCISNRVEVRRARLTNEHSVQQVGCSLGSLRVVQRSGLANCIGSSACIPPMNHRHGSTTKVGIGNFSAI